MISKLIIFIAIKGWPTGRSPTFHNTREWAGMFQRHRKIPSPLVFSLCSMPSSIWVCPWDIGPLDGLSYSYIHPVAHQESGDIDIENLLWRDAKMKMSLGRSCGTFMAFILHLFIYLFMGSAFCKNSLTSMQKLWIEMGLCLQLNWMVPLGVSFTDWGRNHALIVPMSLVGSC